MSLLKTRLDSRSRVNNSFKIIDNNGTVLAEISLLGSNALVGVKTKKGIHIMKPDGWKSKEHD